MTDAVWLVVGLGNPGSTYKNTRHNIGAMVVEHSVKELGEKLSLNKKTNSYICETKLGTVKVIFANLTSYMNESGGPVKSLINFFQN